MASRDDLGLGPSWFMGLKVSISNNSQSLHHMSQIAMNCESLNVFSFCNVDLNMFPTVPRYLAPGVLLGPFVAKGNLLYILQILCDFTQSMFRFPCFANTPFFSRSTGMMFRTVVSTVGRISPKRGFFHEKTIGQ